MTFAGTRSGEHELNRHGFTFRILPLRDLFVAPRTEAASDLRGCSYLCFSDRLRQPCESFVDPWLSGEPEIAVGAALGASRWRLVRQFVTESPYDSDTYAGVAYVLAVVILAAGYFPASRAANLDPRVALRQE